MFTIDRSVLVLIDVQGKLAELMVRRDDLYRHLDRLIRGAQALQIPILWTEQNPTRMGPTVEPLRTLLHAIAPIPKMSFSCAGEPVFAKALAALNRNQIILAGIETHVCVFQTAADLVRNGNSVVVPADAVSSRSEDNYRVGLERIRTAGATIASVESILFELMRTADHPAFRTILALVK